MRECGYDGYSGSEETRTRVSLLLSDLNRENDEVDVDVKEIDVENEQGQDVHVYF